MPEGQALGGEGGPIGVQWVERVRFVHESRDGNSLLALRHDGPMLIGYNTNGFAHHRLEDALVILSELGYESVALTLDYHVLEPFSPELPQEIHKVRDVLNRLGLRSVIETGARFLLDPRHKHQPTLVSRSAAERQRRLEFLVAAVGIAAELGSDAVSFWSGTPVDEASSAVHMERLIEGCRQLSSVAAEKHVRLAFEPEPGMLVDTMTRFEELHRAVHHPRFGLTLDIGHLHCQGETLIEDHLRRWRDWLWNIHIEDMRHGVHEHLMFGEGEIEFIPILRTLQEINYAGGLHVELSRHSHDAVRTAQRAIAFLSRACAGASV
jgi:sugar phosphate isomerase/epimerase